MDKNVLKLRNEIENGLLHFTGTTRYYHYPIGKFNYTDGIKYLADEAKSYWLLDVIGSYQLTTKIKDVPFQLWELIVNENNSAVITMKEDTDEPELVIQEIPCTDFPLQSIKLYLIDKVLLLPSEY